MEGKWANLPPELCVIKDRWLGASCNDNMPTAKEPVNSKKKSPRRERDQPTEVGETFCLNPCRGDDGFEAGSRTSMSPDSLDYIGAGYEKLEAFPLGGRDAPIQSDNLDNRRGILSRLGLNVGACTQKAKTEAVTEQGREGEIGTGSVSSKRQTERRGGNFRDSEAAFGVELAPACDDILRRAKNERLQENDRSSEAIQGIITTRAKTPQGLEMGIALKPSTEARHGDNSTTAPTLIVIKPEVPGLRSDGELINADFPASSADLCTAHAMGTAQGAAQTSTASGWGSQGGTEESRHRIGPLKRSHCKAAHESALSGPAPVPVRASSPPPEPVSDNPSTGKIKISDNSKAGDGSPCASVTPRGPRSNGVSCRLTPLGWTRATAPITPVTTVQPALCASSSRRGSSPSVATVTSLQTLTPMTEVAEVVVVEDRSAASCDTRNTVRTTPALSSYPRLCSSGQQGQSGAPHDRGRIGRRDCLQPVMVVDYHRKVKDCSTVGRHESPAQGYRRGSGSAADKHCWDLPSSLEKYRCHLAIARDGRSGPKGSSFSNRSTDRPHGGEAGGYRSCESSSYLEATGRREKCSARYEAARRRAAMDRAARKTRASAAIGDRVPWGKGRETSAEAERRKLLQRKADYACGLRKKAQEEAQVTRLYLSKTKENFDSSTVVLEARLPTETRIPNNDAVLANAVQVARAGCPLAGRTRGIVPLPCDISPGSPVPHTPGSNHLPGISAVGSRGMKAGCGTGRCGGERGNDRGETNRNYGPDQCQGSGFVSLVEATREEEQLMASIARLDGLLHNATAYHHGSRDHSPNLHHPRADRSDKRPGVEERGRRILPTNRERATNKPPRARNVDNIGIVGKTRARKGGGKQSKQCGSLTPTAASTPEDNHLRIPVEASAVVAHAPVVPAIGYYMARKAPVEFPPLFLGSRFPMDHGGSSCFTEGVVCHKTSHHHEERRRPRHITEGCEQLHPLRTTPSPGRPPSDVGDSSNYYKDHHEQVHEHVLQRMRCLPPFDERHRECKSNRPLAFTTSRGVVENDRYEDWGCACNRDSRPRYPSQGGEDWRQHPPQPIKTPSRYPNPRYDTCTHQLVVGRNDGGEFYS